ncbi:MAG: branched-chain amino acid ABC transporter permease [Chloroflexi bacterium]|nr:branched-chain amino acid ABC transporter permease [Chloroflexota bacterium]
MALPCGTRNYDYARDMAVLRTKTHWALFIGLLVIVFTAPLYLRSYWLGVFNLIGITVIAVIGLNILIGYCGQLSIGHAGFMAVGAYTAAVLTNKLGFPFLAGLICSGFSAGLIGLIFGLPSVRVKGFYLAITTIAAQFIIIWVINHWGPVTGGFVGMSVPYASIGSLQIRSEASQFYLIMAITSICILFAKNLARGRVGRAFIAIRDNDLAAEVMGINLLYYKLLAFFIGCFLAGIAGALFAHWAGFLNAENFTLSDSILYIGMVIIGGLGTTIGPVLGAILIRLLQQAIMYISPVLESAFPTLPSGFTTGIGPMVFGLVIILFLILEPRGLAHRWILFKAAYRLWPFSY